MRREYISEWMFSIMTWKLMTVRTRASEPMMRGIPIETTCFRNLDLGTEALKQVLVDDAI